MVASDPDVIHGTGLSGLEGIWSVASFHLHESGAETEVKMLSLV